MLAFGTDYEYYNAVWVKNEWSRFLQLIAKGEKKILIPCYKNIDAYDMPKEFARLQAQDMGKVGAVQDLLRGIEKIIGKKESSAQIGERVVVNSGDRATVDSLLKRVFMFIEDGDSKSANEYCEKVLDIDPENALAYLGKLLSELRVRKQENLKDQAEPFDHSNNYQKAVRFADEKLKTALAGYIEHINTRNENTRLDSIYTRAKNAMSAANTESAYKEAAHLFESIDEYQDSAVLAQSCYEKAEVARKDAILSEGKSKMTGEIISNYESAIKLFESISGWKDADEKICTCQKKIEEIKARAEAERLEKERKAEIERKEAERIAKRNKKIVIITTPIVCAIIAFIIVLNTVIIPNSKYNDAIALMDAGKLDEAYSIFEELGDYKDVADKAGDIRLQKNKDQLKNIKIGSYINFGAYEQDNNSSNGKEDIEWLVLEVKDGKALVISKYVLDCKPYNTSYTDVTWETCTLRKWLNSNFINSAFSTNEKAMIPTVTVSADENPLYSTNPGNTTQDQVFLLSIMEAKKYFSYNGARQCEATEYAVANGAHGTISLDLWFWWLRSPGSRQNLAVNVASDGDIFESGGGVDHSNDAVRPALWIDLNS
ncbi:MAG: hypothetical protein E7544_01810 [Ruminococcaceae bacterium]|nr:hypothetical protein [Oscillospiraceae bacterium]